MHERTQRAVARLLFVFCCAFPTATTVLCVLVTWTPWYHGRTLRSIEAGLSRDTGLVVEIDDFERIAPSTLSLHGIHLKQPETGRQVADVRQLEWIAEEDEVSILLHQPKLYSSELAGAWQLIHDRFLCRPRQTSVPVQVAAHDLVIDSRSGSQTFPDARAWITPRDRVVEVSMECVPAHSSSHSPVSITVRRDRSDQVPVTRWFLDSGGTPLPCSALAEFLPLMDSLGGDATFLGTMRWQLYADGRWWIDLGGSRFDMVSLDRLFERQSHRLSGWATIQLERCRIEPYGPRSDIVGSIRAREGMIGQTLLYSVNQHLAFQVRIPDSLVKSRTDVPYDQLALSFKVNNTQLQLTGICHTERGHESFPPDVVLSLDLQPLVQSSGKMLDSLKVISAIAPSHSVNVPLSSQTRALMNLFIPPSRPLPSNNQFPPRIRSLEHSSGGPSIQQPN